MIFGLSCQHTQMTQSPRQKHMRTNLGDFRAAVFDPKAVSNVGRDDAQLEKCVNPCPVHDQLHASPSRVTLVAEDHDSSHLMENSDCGRVLENEGIEATNQPLTYQDPSVTSTTLATESKNHLSKRSAMDGQPLVSFTIAARAGTISVSEPSLLKQSQMLEEKENDRQDTLGSYAAGET